MCIERFLFRFTSKSATEKPVIRSLVVRLVHTHTHKRAHLTTKFVVHCVDVVISILHVMALKIKWTCKRTENWVTQISCSHLLIHYVLRRVEKVFRCARVRLVDLADIASMHARIQRHKRTRIPNISINLCMNSRITLDAKIRLRLTRTITSEMHSARLSFSSYKTQLHFIVVFVCRHVCQNACQMYMCIH